MQIYLYNEDWSMKRKFIIVMKIYHCHKKLLLWWNYMTVIKINRCDKNLLLYSKLVSKMKNTLWWNSYKWWLVKIYNSDQNYFLWWLMKQYYCDAKSLLWWKSIILGLPALFGHSSVTIIVLIDHFYEIHQWELIIVMIIQCRDEIHHCDDNLL